MAWRAARTGAKLRRGLAPPDRIAVDCRRAGDNSCLGPGSSLLMRIDWMTWQIEFERLLDGAVLVDRSAMDKDGAIRRAYALIDVGHDVRSVTAPDGSRVGAAIIAEAYLNRFRPNTIIPAQSRELGPNTTIAETIRPGELRGSGKAANAAEVPRALRKARY